MGKLREKHADVIDGLLARYPTKKSAILALMHMAQEEYGYMSKEAMEDVAGIVDVSPTHVLSLAGFYSLYYEEPVGQYVLEICNDLACALRGADEFVEMACEKLGIPVNGTTEDGLFTIKTVMCLAACDKAPMLQCNLKYEENLDEEAFDELIDRLRAEAEAADGKPSAVKKVLDFAGQ